MDNYGLEYGLCIFGTVMFCCMSAYVAINIPMAWIVSLILLLMGMAFGIASWFIYELRKD